MNDVSKRLADDEAALDALTSIPWQGRAILLVDLDAFFASVEQLDHPGWRGKPVIVGGNAGKRGVVSTCSYEARAYGVRSAMPSSTAARLCPNAIWTEGHYDRYREMSNKVMAILWDETPHVQQVSIDEAFMDVTPNEINREHPVLVARRIQRRVEELGVTCSVGVGATKAVAKLASDMDKPRGLTVVLPGSEESFFDPQPLRALSGIGPSAERVLKEHGINTLGELARADDASVITWLGKAGRVMLDRVRSIEDDPIEPDDDVKSVSNEVSFATDMTERSDIMAAICTMAAKTGRRLRRKGLKGHTLALKIRYDDRTVRSVQRPIGMPSDDEFLFESMLDEMLDELWSPGMSVRLVGVAVTGFGEKADDDGQLSLFDAQPEKDSLMGEKRRRGIMTASDMVKERFGESALRFGRELRLGGNTTGSSSKNPADYK
ncbi:MAG: DNA polymerase IV [Eggerthellaceae bacterium]|nr:DNA polymerase IV [Eggerthellaceae bacterium]